MSSARQCLPSCGLKAGRVQKSVLVVEDEFLIAIDLQLMLEELGWREAKRFNEFVGRGSEQTVIFDKPSDAAQGPVAVGLL